MIVLIYLYTDIKIVLRYNDIIQSNNMNTSSKYRITLNHNLPGDVEPIELYANTHQDIANVINANVGYSMLTKTVIVNWICRKKKSEKYSWIDVQFNTNRTL